MAELSPQVCNTLLDFTEFERETTPTCENTIGDTWSDYVDWKTIHVKYGYKWGLLGDKIYEITKHGLINPRPYDLSLTYFISDYTGR